jgi:8-oxo-dGTP pyrophosphatase MutT (NUDIX family)
MHRNLLLNLLNKYNASDANEYQMRTACITFVMANTACFERSLAIGHVTGSAWVINSQKTKVLLMHHRKLNRWFQPGGHCDGDNDPIAVAHREATEETGLTNIKLLNNDIFDIDVHLIPATTNVNEHYHYDIRFLFEALDTDPLIINEESKNLAWVALNDVVNFNDSESIMRMTRKTTQLGTI